MKVINHIKRSYSILFSIVFFLLVINTFQSTWLTVMSPYYRICSFVISFVCISLSVLFIWYLLRHKMRFSSIKSCLIKYEKMILGILFLIIIGIQVYIVLGITEPIGWDLGTLYRIANEMNTMPIENINYLYLEKFPNNIALTLFISNIIGIANDFNINSYLLLSIVNVIAVDIAAGLIFYNCKKIAGTLCAYMSFIIFILLIGFSGWISIPYSDTLSVLFPMLILFFYIQIKQQKKVYFKAIFSLFIGVVVMQGYYLKPTNIFILIAIAICEFILFIINHKQVKVYAISCFCVIIGAFLTATLHDMQIKSTFHHLDKSKEIPMTHFLMMGLNERKIKNGEVTAYGGYNLKDYKLTESQPSYDDKKQMNIKVTKQRLADMNIVGYLKFLKNKANWFLADGTFYWQNEGNFYPQETSYDFALKHNENIKNLYKVGSNTNKILVTLQQGAWTALLCMIPFVVLKRYKLNDYVFILQITVTGIILFLLLFEARSRYLINHLPFIIMLSMIGLRNFAQFINKKQNNI